MSRTSDRVTWGRCPECGGLAVLGWTGQEVVELDCTVAGCRSADGRAAEPAEPPAAP